MLKNISIEGMTCGHCASHVEAELKEVNGVKSVKVDIAAKNALVELEQEVDDALLKEAVENAGYIVSHIE
jgi:copper chaperone